MQIISLILAILSVVEQSATTVDKLIEIGRRSGELTDDQLADLRASMASAFAAPHWRPDSPATLPPLNDSGTGPA